MADDLEPKKPVVARLVTPKPVGADPIVDEDDNDDDDRPRRRRRRDDEEEGDATGGLIPYKNSMALLAYYIGIFGFFLPIIGGIAPIIMGFKGLKYAKEHPNARGQVHAIIGIVLGFFSTFFWTGILAIIIIGILAK